MADKRQNNDLAIDFETFGQDEAKCAVIDCSIVLFNWQKFVSDKPYSFQQLVDETVRYKLNVKDQVEQYKYTIEQDTLNFWQTTDAETRASIAPKKSDITVPQFCNLFLTKLADSKKVDYWWSRSNNFDPPILWRLMRAAGKYYDIGQYLQFQRLRDIRTFIDAKFDFNTVNGFVPVQDEQYWETNFKPHNSQHDIAADVMRLQSITRAEYDLEQVDK